MLFCFIAECSNHATEKRGRETKEKTEAKYTASFHASRARVALILNSAIPHAQLILEDDEATAHLYT